MPTPQRQLPTLGLAATLALGLLGACSSSNDQQANDGKPLDRGTSPSSPNTSASSPEQSTPPPKNPPVRRSPLTGFVVDRRLPSRPVLAVKIPNTAEAQPQRGLGAAELLVEEMVEGGVTRFVTFYYLHTPHTVGPLRSVRLSDVGIVKPVDASLVASGGDARVLGHLRHDEGIRIYREASSAPGYERLTTAVAPYNLVIHLDALQRSLPSAQPPPPYFQFGAPDAFPGKEAAKSVAVTFSSAHTTRWSFKDGKGWIRQNSWAARGHDFVPANLLVLRVRVQGAGYVDASDSPVPTMIVKGAGRALLFHDGKVIAAQWRKPEFSSQLQLTASNGDPLRVPRGRTWVGLIPRTSGSVAYH